MVNAVQLSGYNASQIALIRQTVAKDCNDHEFNLFFEAARRYGLDPFRKQIIALVFNKDKPDKRQMHFFPSRDGFRIIAQRCGDYRPASEPATWAVDDALKSPTNPAGLISCAVRLWKQDKRDEWYPVHGEAYWEEFAPIKDEWAFHEEIRARKPTGSQLVDANWGKIPRVMLQKCAESQALRAGWPDTFGGLYAEEEMHRVQAEMTASEVVAAEAERARLDMIGGSNALTISFDPLTGVMERVPLGKIADRCIAFLRDSTPEDAERWSVQNRVALQEFWGRAPGDALEVKKALEPKLAAFRAAASA